MERIPSLVRLGDAYVPSTVDNPAPYWTEVQCGFLYIRSPYTISLVIMNQRPYSGLLNLETLLTDLLHRLPTFFGGIPTVLNVDRFGGGF